MVDHGGNGVVHTPRQRLVLVGTVVPVGAAVGVVVEFAQVLHQLRAGERDLDQAAFALLTAELGGFDLVELLRGRRVTATVAGLVPVVSLVMV
ncbi:hypothetical protein [Streptomyces inhibens]|uniref:hypothetical protein n=1 Tax=Streptomyces inhibens TaxID=2293571 RepID=UPI001EE733AB|nr:hypothetical protein [Streptomyces inhibens]UKY54973.1 hypothetical protein KI385_43690 [Streptomyces inhibens]